MSRPDTPMTTLAGLLAALRAAASVEPAVLAALKATLALTAAHRPPRTVLRASLHLRPAEGYAGLYVLEAGADRLTPPRADHRLLPSAGAWHAARSRRVAVFVDVVRRTVRPRGAEASELDWRERPDIMSEASQQRLLGRDATHVCVLPLTRGPATVGMIAVELADLSAVGRDPWAGLVDLLDLVSALTASAVTALPAERRPTGPAPDPLLPVIGPTMAPIVQVVEAFAREEETLLIVGETGTGKSRLARWCHACSPRAEGPFEALDLLAVPAETQLGELFGWRRGAFTGAVRDHAGYVTRAAGGTLFVDEVDKLSLDAQAALLALLEERRYRPLGDRDARTADVRFVVGTNADLPAAVRAGRFREDLYYRLDVLSVTLPPLRARMDEVADWARFMLARRAGPGEAPATLSADALAALRARRWPGNLRELDNALRRAAIVAGLRQGGGPPVIEGRDIGPEVSAGLAPEVEPPLAPVAAPPPVEAGALARVAAAHGLVVERLAALDAPPDDLDLAGALNGILLAEAVARTGDRAAAFELVGRGGLVRNRNHHKALRRDCARAAALAGRLGEPVPAAVRDVDG